MNQGERLSYIAMNRLQQFEAEVKEQTSKMLRATKPEPVKQDASFCDDLPNEWSTLAWSDFKIAGGEISVKKWIKDNGFAKCKKSEATNLLIVGEKHESGCFIIGKYKNYWLKVVQGD